MAVASRPFVVWFRSHRLFHVATASSERVTVERPSHIRFIDAFRCIAIRQ
jgi:hypothetical protein